MEFGNYTLLMKLTPGDNCRGWLLTIRRRITRQRMDGHQPTNGWPPQLAQFDTIWPGLPMFGNVSSGLASISPVLPHVLPSVSPVWLILGLVGPV